MRLEGNLLLPITIVHIAGSGIASVTSRDDVTPVPRGLPDGTSYNGTLRRCDPNPRIPAQLQLYGTQADCQPLDGSIRVPVKHDTRKPKQAEIALKAMVDGPSRLHVLVLREGLGLPNRFGGPKGGDRLRGMFMLQMVGL
ncbi:hypothetical protein JB92DRAFT_3291153 [Gautieria morchelliformis]|nr:hypothetical protein JB92DRAFT_3291153 [Gautieria morchelliformis]